MMVRALAALLVLASWCLVSGCAATITGEEVKPALASGVDFVEQKVPAVVPRPITAGYVGEISEAVESIASTGYKFTFDQRGFETLVAEAMSANGNWKVMPAEMVRQTMLSMGLRFPEDLWVPANQDRLRQAFAGAALPFDYLLIVRLHVTQKSQPINVFGAGAIVFDAWTSAEFWRLDAAATPIATTSEHFEIHKTDVNPLKGD